MPGRNTWNGAWSGDGRLFAIIRRYKSQKAEKRARSILERSAYSYSWTDGWRARVTVRQVNFADARRLRRESKGFCGYDWMVDSIESDQKIIAPHEREEG
ncbi:MAG: hypothetical protein NWE89_00665 [Candidatus Bathyarchaeota archaeon]|nr:hypothetical protein [Candidatus Bathyarchaeota archaeon]